MKPLLVSDDPEADSKVYKYDHPHQQTSLSAPEVAPAPSVAAAASVWTKYDDPASGQPYWSDGTTSVWENPNAVPPLPAGLPPAKRQRVEAPAQQVVPAAAAPAAATAGGWQKRASRSQAGVFYYFHPP